MDRAAAGAWIRQRRRAHGLSQAQLALRAGSRQPTISRIETGREVPTVERLAQLLLALGERLDLSVEPLDPERSPEDIAADRARSMAQRLEDGFALAAFASRLARSARR